MFALFLNDIETFFLAQKWNTLICIDKLYNDSNDGINAMLNMFVLVLLCVDMTVLMAENEHDMQRNLDLLNIYPRDLCNAATSRTLVNPAVNLNCISIYFVLI